MTIWKVIPSRPDYEASDDGQVRRLGGAKGAVHERVLKPSVSEAGYLWMHLNISGCPKKTYVHRAVCEAFHGPSPQPRMDVAHADGDKKHNHPSNLRWATRAENEADKVVHGRSNRGERNGMAKVTDAQALELKTRAALLPRSSGGKRIKKGALGPLAAEYGLSNAGATLIISGSRRLPNGNR